MQFYGFRETWKSQGESQGENSGQRKQGKPGKVRTFFKKNSNNLFYIVFVKNLR